MALDREKILTNLCIGLYFFLCGVEYAVILPTLNGYLLSLQGTAQFLGIIMASFSFTGLIAAPIYGRITDKTGSTKACIIVGNLFEIAGNFLYFMSSNKYMVWGSRLIAGAGSGARSSIFGMVSKTTTTEERTTIFSKMLGLRQIGLIIGPACNVFLHVLDFKIGPFIVDEFTSPGLFMAIVWSVHTILVVFLFKDRSRAPPGCSGSTTINGDVVQEYEVINSQESIGATAVPKVVVPVKSFVKEFFREEVIVCLFGSFTILFCQTGIEAAVTPLTLLFFGWGGVNNSYFYCGGGFVVVASFAMLTVLSKKFVDRALLLTGCFGLVLSYAMFLTYSVYLYVEDYDSTPDWLLPAFLANVMILILSLPFVWVPQASLFSKVTSVETQAFNQGIRLSVMGIGQITGPIWATPMATLDRLYIMVAVNLTLTCILTFMVCLSYKFLLPASGAGDARTRQNGSNERTPLLRDQSSPERI